MALKFESSGAAVKLRIKVVPGASKSELSEWLGEILKVRVAAQPEKGKANAAVLALLSEKLNLPRQSLAIISGATSPNKVIEIQGMDLAGLKEKLAFISR